MGAERATPGLSVTGALAALSLAMLLSSLGTSIAGVALPTLARTFDASFQTVQWIVLAYLLASTTLIVGAGRLGDLVGRRRLLLSGIALFTAASALCALAPTLALLVAARAVQGIGAAVMLALTVAFVGDIVAPAQLGRSMGLLGTMSATGTALGPSLGGVLIAALTWRALFVINVPLGLVAFGLAYRYLPSDREALSAERAAYSGFDITGTALLGVSLATYAAAVTVGHGAFGRMNVALLMTSVLALAAFVRVEMRAASPLIDLGMLRTHGLRAGLAMSALVSTVMMATLVVGPFYLARAIGLDARAVGFALAVGPIVTGLSGVPAGRTTDRLGARRVTIGGLIGIASGATALATLPPSFGIAGYLGAIVVMTSGYGFFQTANNTAVMAHVPSARRGVTSGLLSLSRNLGLITGASVMGAVFAVASSSSHVALASAADMSAGLHATFAVAALLMVGALSLAHHTRSPAPALVRADLAT